MERRENQESIIKTGQGMRMAASGARPLLAMTVKMSWVENIGHSEGVARGNPLFSLPPLSGESRESEE